MLFLTKISTIKPEKIQPPDHLSTSCCRSAAALDARGGAAGALHPHLHGREEAAPLPPPAAQPVRPTFKDFYIFWIVNRNLGAPLMEHWWFL